MASATIHTPRLKIEPFSEVHLSARYVGWLNNPQTMQFSENRHRRHTLEGCRDYWRSFDGTPNFFWAITTSSLGHIGNLNAYVDERHGTADVGILIGEAAAAGKGFGTEAWLGACDHLLRVAGLRKVTGGTIAPNIAMVKIMEHTGMVPDGCRVGQYLWNDQPVDVVHYAFFRDAWLTKYPQGPFAKA